MLTPEETEEHVATLLTVDGKGREAKRRALAALLRDAVEQGHAEQRESDLITRLFS